MWNCGMLWRVSICFNLTKFELGDLPDVFAAHRPKLLPLPKATVVLMFFSVVAAFARDLTRNQTRQRWKMREDKNSRNGRQIDKVTNGADS